MRNVSEEICREIENTHFIFTDSPPLPLENRAVYETVWKNIVQLDSPQMTVWRMLIACWIPKATNTHTEDV